MRAVAYFHSLPIEDSQSLLDVEVPAPEPGPRDLVVRVSCVSVNPIDTKVRRRSRPQGPEPRILGWDAVGVVERVGAEVQRFSPGERVWYAGALDRPGCNAELQAVDERLVAHAPRNLDDPAAAALPLTSITARELLFDRLCVDTTTRDATLLVTAGGGGVGSMVLQLARELTGLQLVATASRPESRAWAREMGAHHVVDHSRPLVEQLRELPVPPLRYAIGVSHTGQHFDALVEALAPQGKLAVIDDFEPGDVDVTAMKRKSLSLHWEMMFTRSLFQTDDMEEQGKILAEVARLLDAGQLRSSVREVLGPIDAATLRDAHARLEAGHTTGKLVLQGFAKAPDPPGARDRR